MALMHQQTIPNRRVGSAATRWATHVAYRLRLRHVAKLHQYKLYDSINSLAGHVLQTRYLRERVQRLVYTLVSYKRAFATYVLTC